MGERADVSTSLVARRGFFDSAGPLALHPFRCSPGGLANTGWDYMLKIIARVMRACLAITCCLLADAWFPSRKCSSGLHVNHVRLRVRIPSGPYRRAGSSTAERMSLRPLLRGGNLPRSLPHPSEEFFVNAIAAGEARESSLARLPETSAWRVPRRGSDECWAR